MTDRAPSSKRLVTLLATDVVGSVDLKRRLGHDRAADLIARHDEVIKEAVGRQAGAEVLVDTGDGFIISFTTPEQAVEAALALLVELRSRLGGARGWRCGRASTSGRSAAWLARGRRRGRCLGWRWTAPAA